MGCSGQTLWQDRVSSGPGYSAMRCFSPTSFRVPMLARDFMSALEGFTTSSTSTFQTFQGSRLDSLLFSDRSFTLASPGSSVSSILKRAIEPTVNSGIRATSSAQAFHFIRFLVHVVTVDEGRVGEEVPRVPDGGGVILVGRSKTDQEGEGKVAYISPSTMTLIDEWQEESGIGGGYLLRSIRKNHKPSSSLDIAVISRIYKNLAKRAGLSETTVRGLSSHSARVGAAQDMAAAGIDLIAIMQAGGWKSPEIVGRYIENLDVLRGGSYRLAMMQKR